VCVEKTNYDLKLLLNVYVKKILTL